MMSNLFSIFDPCLGVDFEERGWLSAGLGLIIIPYVYWNLPSRYFEVFSYMEKVVLKEVMAVLGCAKSMLSLAFIATFFMVLMVNSVGLLPWVFTSSSHLTFSLTLVLPLWFGYFLRGWAENTIYSLAHLVPLGTPVALMSFMVLIETISALIRPLTLSVRLAANMIAGHLLLALMGGAIEALSPASVVVVTFLQVLLVLLETAVAVIQAYVITLLSALYVSES